uniref:Serpin domain-containing protein n=1 Tax=Panagrolaimus davidi TaxID=227884 RepID=A0A914RCB5_9BILA
MSLEAEIIFALDFLSFLEESSELDPVIFSPASILNGLSMILAASDGNTAEQIVSVIGKGQIKYIATSKDIDPNASVILINALYFSSSWEKKFFDRTPKLFKSNPPRYVEMMTNVDMSWIYNEGEDWKSIGIPYKDKKAYMYIILPNEDDGLSKIIKKMDPKLFYECTKP